MECLSVWEYSTERARARAREREMVTQDELGDIFHWVAASESGTCVTVDISGQICNKQADMNREQCKHNTFLNTISWALEFW